jgi:hypothetical protein
MGLISTTRPGLKVLTTLALILAGCAGEERGAVIRAPGLPVDVSEKAYKACEGGTAYVFSPDYDFSACGEVAFELQQSVFDAGHFANYPVYMRYLRRVCDNPVVTHRDADLCLDFLSEIKEEDRLKNVPRADVDWGIQRGMALCPISRDVFRNPSDCRPVVSLMETLNYPAPDLWTARNTGCASGDQRSCQDLGMEEAEANAHVKPIRALVAQARGARTEAGREENRKAPDAPAAPATGLQSALNAVQSAANAVPSSVTQAGNLAQMAAANSPTSQRQQLEQDIGSQLGKAALKQAQGDAQQQQAPAVSAGGGGGGASASTSGKTPKTAANANKCVSASYDSAIGSMAADAAHQSYTFQNTCSKKIYVVWRAKGNGLPGCASSDYLEPGAKLQTGLYPNDVQACGGIAVAACPKFHSPLTASGKNWDKASDGFYCR